MEWNQLFFDETVTRNKVQGYRGSVDEESSAADHASETYAVMVEDFEKVSDMLKQTQAALWKSQDEVKTYSSKTKLLESTLEQKDYDVEHYRRLHGEVRDENYELREEVKRLNSEILDRDEGRSRPELEKRLRKAVELMKRDLDTTVEKHKTAQEEILAQQRIIADLRQANKSLEETSQLLPMCQKQLCETTEGSAILLEEVAKLREELNATKKVADQKDVIIRREVEYDVKEKIKLEVSKTVTKQVTEKVTRELTTKFKAERETELTALREQIKKIVKENASLKSRIERAEQMESEAHALQQTIDALTYDLTRYESMIDEARQLHERRLIQLETDYRIKLQTQKEEAARDKWEHATEIRQQITLEREREVQDFNRRIEDLSKETDRLLERAEKEKKKYGEHIRKQTQLEMKAEVMSLTEKLEARTKESDQLLRGAGKDKKAITDNLRKTIEYEKRKEISKLACQIEALTEEKYSLERKIESFEDEMNHVWALNENQIEQLKVAQSEVKRLTDENLKLHRKLQNLTTLSNRYKHDTDEARRDLRESKEFFREALLKSEELNLKLKAKLKESAPGENMSRERFADTLQTLEDAKKSLIDRMKQYAKENTQLVEENGLLRKALSEKNARPWKASEPKDWCNAIEATNDRIKQKSASLTSFLVDVMKQGLAPKNDLLLAMEAENVQLKSIMDDTRTLIRKCRKEIQKSPAEWENETECLKEQSQITVELLERYCDHRTRAASDLEALMHSIEEGQTVFSDDDRVQSNPEIQILDRMLGELKESMNPSSTDEVERLKSEVEALKSILDTPLGCSSSHGDTSTEVDKHSEMEPEVKNYYYETLRSELAEVQSDKSKLEDRVEDLNYIIEKYRNELSRASQDLENTKRTLVMEEQMAQQLSRRVESLNHLLDTTEQKLAENTKQLAQSRRHFEDVTKASKREIERLNKDSNNLRELLKQKAQQCGNDKREHQKKVDEANAEVRGWKSRVRALENEIRRHQDEFEKSKAMYDEALDQSEEEIVRLKNHMEVIVASNLNNSEESKTLGDSAMDMEILESKTHARKMDNLLQKTKDKSATTLKKMEASEAGFLNALRDSEGEKVEILRSLDDIKKSLLGKSSEESSHDHSLRQSTRDAGRDVAELQIALASVSSCEGSLSDHSSVNVFSRFDDFLSMKKKRVSWKEIDEDNPANLSHRSVEDGIHTETVSQYGMPELHRDKPGSTTESQLQQANTSINGTSWDDSTIASMDLEQNSNSSIQYAKAMPKVDKFQGDAQQSHRSPTEPQNHGPKKKVVSWDIWENETDGSLAMRASGESRDPQNKRPLKEHDNKELREPIIGRGKQSPNDKAETIRASPFASDQGLPDDDLRDAPFGSDRDRADDNIRDTTLDSNQGPVDDDLREAQSSSDQDMADGDLREPPIDSCHRMAADHLRGLADDESTSTIDWHIPQPGDTVYSLSGSEGTNQDRGTYEKEQRFRESVTPTFELPSLSASSSFSYSSNESFDSSSAGRDPINANILDVIQEEDSPVSPADGLPNTPLSFPTRSEKHSRFRRARGTLSRRARSKDVFTPVLGDKKTGPHSKILPRQIPDDQPFDEGVKQLPSAVTGRDTGGVSESMAHITDTARSSE